MKKVLLALFVLGVSSAFSQEINDSLKVNGDLFKDIKVIPNPTSEILFIRNGEEIDSYQLFNLSGQKVQESKNNPQVISLLNEEVGFYFLIFEIDGVFKTYRVEKY